MDAISLISLLQPSTHLRCQTKPMCFQHCSGGSEQGKQIREIKGEEQVESSLFVDDTTMHLETPENHIKNYHKQ